MAECQIRSMHRDRARILPGGVFKSVEQISNRLTVLEGPRCMGLNSSKLNFFWSAPGQAEPILR